MSDEPKPEMTEAEMRDAEAAHPKTPEELTAYVESLVNRGHDYGTCVYAMSLAATAAFNYVAGKLGVTGFQASCADMDIIRRTRGMKDGFIIVDGNNLLYPQYDVLDRVAQWMAGARGELAKKAKVLLAEKKTVHPDVVAHWERLAAFEGEEAST
jgi:hypothetical protein